MKIALNRLCWKARVDALCPLRSVEGEKREKELNGLNKSCTENLKTLRTDINIVPPWFVLLILLLTCFRFQTVRTQRMSSRVRRGGSRTLL